MKLLSQIVSEYIVDGEFPVVYLTGEGDHQHNPDEHHCKKLAKALTALGYDDAAKIVMSHVRK